MAQLGSGPFFLRKARRVGEVFGVSSGATGKLCCCCLALSGSPVTLGRDILCQKSDKPGKPSHGAKCNTWNAPADIGNWTELFWGFGMTLDAACHEGSAQHCSEHVCFPAMTFPVLPFPRLLVWQCRDKAPVHRGDDADPHSQVPVLGSGANRPVLLGQGCDGIFPTN